MRVDRPLLGILLMVGFCATAPTADAIAKLLGDTIPLLELLIARFVVQAALLLPLMWCTGRRLVLSRGAFGLTVVRTLLHIVGVGAMFTALRFLPLADAIAMAFVMPFIMLFLGRLVLGEDIGPHRLAACAVGFAGTLLVVQPSFAVVGAPALLPLLVALIFALFMLVSRKLAVANDPVGLQAISGMLGTAILVPVALLAQGSGWPPLELIVPGRGELVLLAAVGFFGTLGHLLMTWALRFAPAATLAPIQYLEIPFATVVGWLVFRDLPNELAAWGICITMGAGLYIVMIERLAPQPMASQT